MRKPHLPAAMILCVASAAHGQTCSAPGPATLAGYTTQTLGGSPANWLPTDASGTGTTVNADGSVTIASPTNNSWNGQLQSYANGQGAAFGSGGYFQATLSWSGNYSGSGGWPSFWADSTEGATDRSHWTEADFMEAWANDHYSGTLHNWLNNGAINQQTSSGGIYLPSGSGPATPHTYGFLWVPATAATQGYAKWFLDGQQQGSTVTWNQGDQAYGYLDQQHLTLFLGTGSNPMTVSNVQVWQNPATANDIGVSPAAAGSGCAPVQPMTPTAIEQPPPVALQEVTPGQGAVASNGNAWSVSADGHAMVNDTPIPGGGGTSAIEVVDGVVWGQDNGKGPSPCSDCWFTLSADGQDWTPKPGESPFGPAPTPQQQTPIACGTQIAGGTFRTVGGQIVGPDGQPWIARGLNLYDNQMGSAGAMTGTFTGLNFVRVNIHSYQDPSAYQSFVTEMTSAGRVIEFEDHSDGAGGGQSAGPPKGMAAELSWYANMARAYASNPYVWFGTFNEPATSGGPISLSQWQRATYDTIRGAGNNNPILLEVSGSRSWNLQQALTPGTYASMSNVIWDVHVYGYQTDYSTDQATVDANVSAMATAAQRITSADGVVPVHIGEFGPSTDGTNDDPNGVQNVTAVINSGARGKFGSSAWAYDPGGNADHVTQGGQVTSPYGQMVQLFVNTDVVAPTQCQLNAAAQQAINAASTK